jgi:anti-sigma factor RsiW
MTDMSTPCRDLQRFADGEMPPADRPAFHRHLGRCRACQDELELVVMLDALASSFAPAQPRRARGLPARHGLRPLMA